MPVPYTEQVYIIQKGNRLWPQACSRGQGLLSREAWTKGDETLGVKAQKMVLSNVSLPQYIILKDPQRDPCRGENYTGLKGPLSIAVGVSFVPTEGGNTTRTQCN